MIDLYAIFLGAFFGMVNSPLIRPYLLGGVA